MRLFYTMLFGENKKGYDLWNLGNYEYNHHILTNLVVLLGLGVILPSRGWKLCSIFISARLLFAVVQSKDFPLPRPAIGDIVIFTQLAEEALVFCGQVIGDDNFFAFEVPPGFDHTVAEISCMKSHDHLGLFGLRGSGTVVIVAFGFVAWGRG